MVGEEDRSEWMGGKVARFFLARHTKMVKIYQMATEMPTQWPQNGKNVPNCSKNAKYSNISHSKALQNLPKLKFFGMTLCHLATLEQTAVRKHWQDMDTDS
jgi:hypothetical protein